MLKSINLESNQRQGVIDKIKAETNLSTAFLGLSAISTLIAGFSLLIGDIAFLVGAMLISPFLGPILALGMGIVKGNLKLFKKGTIIVLAGIGVGIAASTIIAALSPVKTINEEIISRSSPTLIQLLIAIFAGAAAAFSYAYRKITAVLAGAFIALALVPPIAIIGIGIAFYNFEVAGGAFLLLTANLIGLILASVVVFFGFGFRPVEGPESLRDAKLGITWLAILLFLIALPLGYIMQNIITKQKEEKTAKKIISQNLNQYSDTRIDQLKTTQLSGDKLKVSFTIYSPEQIEENSVRNIKKGLERELNKDVEIDTKLVPTIKIDY